MIELIKQRRTEVLRPIDSILAEGERVIGPYGNHSRWVEVDAPLNTIELKINELIRVVNSLKQSQNVKGE